jgi:hypothetical protein
MEKKKEKTHTRVYFRKREKKYPWLPSKFPNQRNPKSSPRIFQENEPVGQEQQRINKNSLSRPWRE